MGPDNLRVDLCAALALLLKVEELGFKFRPVDANWDDGHGPLDHGGRHRPATCPLTVRWVGDRYCLRFELGDVSFRSRRWAQPPPPPAFTTVWWRGGAPCSPLCGPAQPDIVPRIWTLPYAHVQ